MSTAVVKSQGVPRQVNRKGERFFFSGMALLMLATVLAGFWPTYYGAGLINAPLPNAVVHVHGALFSLWMILLLVQVGLISAKKVKVHRTLGLAGFVLAVLMVVVGVLTGTLQLRRNLNVSGPVDACGCQPGGVRERCAVRLSDSGEQYAGVRHADLFCLSLAETVGCA